MLYQCSPGGFDSLVMQMENNSFFYYSTDYRKSISVVDNLVYIALAFDDVEDLIANLDQALKKV